MRYATLLHKRTSTMSKDNQILEEFTQSDYKYGFESNIESESAPKGLNEDTIRFISQKKDEPAWLLEWRLKAYHHWLTLKEPNWHNVKFSPIDYQDIIYYAAPKQKAKPSSLDEVDPELLDTFKRLGISLQEQKRLTGVAVDAVFDSVSVATTFREKLGDMGIIFCSFQRSGARASGADPEISRLGGASGRQLLCGPQLGGV